MRILLPSFLAFAVVAERANERAHEGRARARPLDLGRRGGGDSTATRRSHAPAVVDVVGEFLPLRRRRLRCRRERE